MEVQDVDADPETELIEMKKELLGFGFAEENLSKDEMKDLLRALKESNTTAKEDELLNHKEVGGGAGSVEGAEGGQAYRLRRRHVGAPERRLPWSLVPRALSAAQRAALLAAYLKLRAVNRWRQARRAHAQAAWGCVRMARATPVPPSAAGAGAGAGWAAHAADGRATRSGRAAPLYLDLDGDGDGEGDGEGDGDGDEAEAEGESEGPAAHRQARKRKLAHDTASAPTPAPAPAPPLPEGLYSHKTLSLKRRAGGAGGAEGAAQEGGLEPAEAQAQAQGAVSPPARARPRPRLRH